MAVGDNKMKIFIEVQLSKIKKTSEEKSLDLLNTFIKHDKQKNGSIDI